MNNNSNPESPWVQLAAQGNPLGDYLKSLPLDTVSLLSQPTPEAAQVMESNLVGLLGGLPHSQFQVQVTTSREALGQLLVSAMLSGYFIRNAEQRLAMEKSLPSN